MSNLIHLHSSYLYLYTDNNRGIYQTRVSRWIRSRLNFVSLQYIFREVWGFTTISHPRSSFVEEQREMLFAVRMNPGGVEVNRAIRFRTKGNVGISQEYAQGRRRQEAKRLFLVSLAWCWKNRLRRQFYDILCPRLRHCAFHRNSIFRSRSRSDIFNAASFSLIDEYIITVFFFFLPFYYDFLIIFLKRWAYK